MPAQAIIDDFQTTVASSQSSSDATLDVTATFPVEARDQNLLLRVEDDDGSGGPAGTNVELMLVSVPADGVGPVDVVSRPVAPTTAVAHAAGSIITAVVNADTLRDRLGDFYITRTKMLGFRAMAWDYIYAYHTIGAPGDAADADGRFVASIMPLVPSDAPLAYATTYIDAAAPAGLTGAKMYACDPETYKVLGRTADFVAAGQWTSAGRKTHALIADAGASLVIPKDQKTILWVLRMVGSAAANMMQLVPPVGSILTALESGWVAGYGDMNTDPAANAEFSTSLAAGAKFNEGWNTQVWGAFE